MIYWYHPPDYWNYLEHATWINSQIMQRFNAEGIDFAFPTQTLHVAMAEGLPASGAASSDATVNTAAIATSSAERYGAHFTLTTYGRHREPAPSPSGVATPDDAEDYLDSESAQLSDGA